MGGDNTGLFRVRKLNYREIVRPTCYTIPGASKLLSAVGSAAVLFNGNYGIKESWRLARKILSHFKWLGFLNAFGNTLLAILHLEIVKNLFAAGSAKQLNSPQAC